MFPQNFPKLTTCNKGEQTRSIKHLISASIALKATASMAIHDIYVHKPFVASIEVNFQLKLGFDQSHNLAAQREIFILFSNSISENHTYCLRISSSSWHFLAHCAKILMNNPCLHASSSSWSYWTYYMGTTLLTTDLTGGHVVKQHDQLLTPNQHLACPLHFHLSHYFCICPCTQPHCKLSSIGYIVWVFIPWFIASISLSRPWKWWHSQSHAW